MNDAKLSASWRLVENLSDNRFRAELTLENYASEPLVPPWELYFNSSRPIASSSIESPLTLQHVNGDFYVLRADAAYPPIEANDKRVVQMIGSPWAINVSDAPSGLYMLLGEATSGHRPPICLPLSIQPFPNADVIRRGEGDQTPVVTPAARFRASESLAHVPPDELPPVLPTPLRVKSLSGRVEISPATVIDYEPPLDDEARYLANCLRESFDLDVERTVASDDRRNAIRLRLGSVTLSDVRDQPNDESYLLSVRPETGIEIVGTNPAGVFYGIQTLRGLLPVEAYARRDKRLSIAAVEIKDAPRFGYRGLHLDVARNFQTVEEVKKLLELMSFYKLNRFHWHLTDDEGWRIEIKALPELMTVGGRRGQTTDESECLIPSFGSGPIPDRAVSPGCGYYSHEELIDLLRFAQARHITVIPELDFPGHARAAIKAMAARERKVADADASNEEKVLRLTHPDDTSKYESVQMWRDNVVDVCQATTYGFLDLVVSELAEVYRRAGMKLECVHLGGDEVPGGAWENSPACRSIPASDGPMTRNQQLQLSFLERACDLLAKYDVTAACWEDCLLFTDQLQRSAQGAATGNWPTPPTAYVWNNVWGWGREDAAYRLANAGCDVVLSNATHLYFDLACEKDPLEPGYYWAGFVDTRAPFEFNPLDVFQNARTNSLGEPLATQQFSGHARLSREGQEHILGIQGQLWGENLRSALLLEYMAFPRTIALAERAWAAEPNFATNQDSTLREQALTEAWNEFANCLGQRELPRLDYLVGSVDYRLPPPGAVIRAGILSANVAYPGLTIRYSTDGSEPSTNSPVYRDPIAVQRSVKLRAFDTRGRGSRTTTIESPTVD